MAEWFADSKNWVFIGLILFFAVVAWAGAHKTVLKALDSRADGISTALAQAEQLRKEAEDLAASYRAKRETAEAEATAIVEQAKADAESLLREAERQLAEDVARRERQVEERIARAEQQAGADVRAVAAEAAIAAAERLLRQDPNAHPALVRQGVAEIATRFG